MESTLKRNVLTFLKERGIPCWKVAGGIYNPAGIPDIVGCIPPFGTMLMIELKDPDAKPRNDGSEALQAKNIKRYRAAGACAFQAISVDEVRNQLDYFIGLHQASV